MRRVCVGMWPLILAVLLLAERTCPAVAEGHGRQPPRLIVKFNHGEDGVAATAAGPASLTPIASELNLYTVAVPEGQTAEQRAAELSKLAGVAYAVPDEWVRTSAAAAAADDSDKLRQSRGPARRRQLLAAPRRPPPMPLQRRQPAPRAPAARLPRPPPPRPRPPLPRRKPPSPPPRPRHRPPPSGAVPREIPKDLYYKELWGMSRIRASTAWYYARNSTALTCIVDTGVMYDHPDLVDNLVPMSQSWKDRNYDDNGHGTHVAGIMGAVGNNKYGVTGVSWHARILACKALDATGWGLISDVIRCLHWCRKSGARVINTSFELDSPNMALRDAIHNGTASGIFFAGAAGNTEYGGNDNDAANRYPGGFHFPGNVAVANTNTLNRINYNSNYGAKTVQLAAPGTQILSTWIYRDYANSYYKYLTGTSMAAPVVSGAAALAITASGGMLTNVQVANLLISTSTPVAALQGKVVANGIVNLAQLVVEAKRLGTAAAARCAAVRAQQGRPPPARAAG